MKRHLEIGMLYFVPRGLAKFILNNSTYIQSLVD